MDITIVNHPCLCLIAPISQHIMLPKSTVATAFIFNWVSPIEPILGLPRARSPLTSAINTLLAVQYTSILSKSPHLLCSLNHSTRTPYLFQLCMRLFIPKSINSRYFHQTSRTRHLNNIHFPPLTQLNIAGVALKIIVNIPYFLFNCRYTCSFSLALT